jgi:hypothetical protein
VAEVAPGPVEFPQFSTGPSLFPSTLLSSACFCSDLVSVPERGLPGLTGLGLASFPGQPFL